MANEKNPSAKGLLPSEILELGWVRGTFGLTKGQGKDDRTPKEIERGTYPTGGMGVAGNDRKAAYRCAVGGIQQAMYTKAIPAELSQVFYDTMADAICNGIGHIGEAGPGHKNYSGDSCIITWNDRKVSGKTEVVSAFENVEFAMGLHPLEEAPVAPTDDAAPDYSDKEPYVLGSTSAI